MKVQGAKKVHYESGPNMTPLVDVVMCLLIFLMMVGTFMSAQHYLQTNIPLTQSGVGGTPPPPGFVPDEPLDIRVDPDPRDPRGFIARVGNTRATDADALKTGLIARKNAFIGAGTAEDKIQVIISPGRNVKYNALIAVYEAALDAGLKKVSFATAH
jgi:biopolymer transport protein ExbD